MSRKWDINPLKHKRLLSILFFVLFFSVLLYVGSVSYTGLAIADVEQFQESKNQNILLNSKFEILELQKTPNSVLDFEIESDLALNIFTEIEDCQYWLNGNDKDDAVLYAVNSIKKGNFKIGDPSLKTMQQIQIYQTGYLCLILINREHPEQGNVNFKYNEVDINKWKII